MHGFEATEAPLREAFGDYVYFFAASIMLKLRNVNKKIV